MRKSFTAAAVLAVAALSLGACNNPNDDAAANADVAADTAATMPADNSMMGNTMDTNTMGVNTVDGTVTVGPDGMTTNVDGTTSGTTTTNTTP